MAGVRNYVESLNVTQKIAAARLRLNQPRLNALLRGNLDRFSLDMLVNVLARAGKRVSVTVVENVG